jgi:hypothetical protein
MPNIHISKRYIDNVLTPLKDAVDMALIFKDPDTEDVVISTYDSDGSSWICIKATSSDINFNDDNIRVMDLKDLVTYINLVEYGKNDSATIEDIFATTARGNRYSTIKLSGDIGQFIMPMAPETSFNDVNYKPHANRGDEPAGKFETLFSFSIPAKELKKLSDIGSKLGVSAVTITMHPDRIELRLKGKSNSQYTKTIVGDNISIKPLRTNESGEAVYYSDEDSYEEYLPFSYDLFKFADNFGGDFLFDVVRSISGVHAIKAYGKNSPSGDEDGNDIRYSIINSTKPNVGIGDEVDVFRG